MMRAGWALALLVLVAAGAGGLHGGFNDWPGAETTLQKSVTGGNFVYGVLALIGAVGLAMRRRWCVSVIAAWGVIVTYVPGAAVLGYAPDGTWGAALAASASAGVIAALVLWAAHVATRGREAVPSPS